MRNNKLKNKSLVIGFLETHTQLEPGHIAQIKQISKNIKIEIYNIENIANHAEEIDILLSFRLPNNLLNNAKSLKWIHALSAGVNTIVPKIKDTNILLTNSSGVHPIPIAEHVFGMILMHARKLDKALLAQKRKEWKGFKFHEVEELYGKTMLILGYGNIGQQLGKVGKAFSLKIIGMKRTKTKADYADKIITVNELKKYIPLADYIIIALPSTPATVKFFDRKYLSLMKKGSVIINIGRGSVIDEKELIKTLKSKNIFPLLDVFETEPLPADSELWSLDNVFITAHYAGATPRYMDRAIDIFCENLKAYLAKKQMPNLVDNKLGY